MSTFIVPPNKTLAIALGANKTSPVGLPITTLIHVRPLLEKIITEWSISSLKENIAIKSFSKDLRFRWSPLFATKPIGGPSNQADFINAVLVIDGPSMDLLDQSKKAILNLLKKTLLLEKEFGRDRTHSSIIWGPRSLDIDLLAWGGLQVKHKDLILPHPRLIERSFVITPLAAILNSNQNSAPKRLKPQPGWYE